MLRFLTIRRLAVIDSVQVEFDPGLNVLTGETGAGKSILVEAVGLLLGGRASGDLVRTGEETAIIEAVFETDGREWLVRREITAQGRSRAFINGDLTTAGALRDLANRLIELHGQHEHQTLLDPSTHLGLLDAFAHLDLQRAEVADAFVALQAATQDVARLRKALSERDARQELAAFQLAELDKAAPVVGEDDELAALKQVLGNAERVERLCEDSYAQLYDKDDAVLSLLGGIWRRVGELAELDPVFQPYVDARTGIKSQLEDLALHLRHYADGIEASPARLQQVEDRLAALERLKRKHGPTLADVITRRDALRTELAELAQGVDALASLEQVRAEAAATYKTSATTLSLARRKAAAPFGAALERLLADLAMDATRFDVRFADPLSEAEWTVDGIDRAEFYLSPNLGEELRPLARIVSGGELSRVMLALKTLTATSRVGFSDATSRAPSAATPGLVFDEVDAGIGGRVADVVGGRLRTLGSAFQVLCITHQPQIAAYADTHFLIEKSVEEGRTRTTVHRLDRDGRINELSRMLGGANVSARLKESAREMLDARHVEIALDAKGEYNAKGESESRSRAKAKPVAKRPSA
jgi:DNA repair protein RecN (Recombination protein N)